MAETAGYSTLRRDPRTTQTGRGQRGSFVAGAAVATVYDVLATDGVAEDRREGSIHDLHHGLALADRGKTPEDLLL